MTFVTFCTIKCSPLPFVCRQWVTQLEARLGAWSTPVFVPFLSVRLSFDAQVLIGMVVSTLETRLHALAEGY
jgi:hypothetical protein